MEVLVYVKVKQCVDGMLIETFIYQTFILTI